MIVEVWCRPWLHDERILGAVWVCMTSNPAGELEENKYFTERVAKVLRW